MTAILIKWENLDREITHIQEGDIKRQRVKLALCKPRREAWKDLSLIVLGTNPVIP